MSKITIAFDSLIYMFLILFISRCPYSGLHSFLFKGLNYECHVEEVGVYPLNSLLVNNIYINSYTCYACTTFTWKIVFNGTSNVSSTFYTFEHIRNTQGTIYSVYNIA